MSRIAKLIEDLCSNGVEYKTIRELFDTRNGYTPSKSNTTFWENGTIPWFRMEDIRENGRILSDSIQHVSEHAVKGEIFPENSLIIATSATIGEHALITVPSLANQRFTYLMLKKEWENSFDIKFLFYYCYKLDEWCLSHLNQGNFASVDMKQFQTFKFPVPPLEVQREIVRVLDRFTLLSAELSAELKERKLQYEYYREQLIQRARENHPSKRIDEIGTLTRGKRFVHADAVDKGLPCIHYGELYTYYGVWTTDTKSHVRSEIEKKLRFAEKNDVVIVGAGENDEDIGIAVAYLGEEKVAIHDACYYLHHDQNPKYISYCLRTDDYHKQIKKYVSRGKICAISLQNIGKAVIPVPPLSEQNRIVEILDGFDSLCSDISHGLPAEIEARQKQYEYYRDKLLAFEEKKEA